MAWNSYAKKPTTKPKAPAKPKAPPKHPRKSLRERFICYALTGAARVDWDPDDNSLCRHEPWRAAKYAIEVADEAIERLEGEGWFDDSAADGDLGDG